MAAEQSNEMQSSVKQNFDGSNHGDNSPLQYTPNHPNTFPTPSQSINSGPAPAQQESRPQHDATSGQYQSATGSQIINASDEELQSNHNSRLQQSQQNAQQFQNLTNAVGNYNHGTTEPQMQQIQTPHQAPQTTPVIQPLLSNIEPTNQIVQNPQIKSDSTSTGQQQTISSNQKTVITKVRLTDDLNIFDWFNAADLLNQIAEKAKSSVDSVITTLDPGMKEYLYSGGNVKIMVACERAPLVSPVRDAFQTVFGRATVYAAKFDLPNVVHPVKLASGRQEAIELASERIKLLRSDTNNVPQNQVIAIIQPALEYCDLGPESRGESHDPKSSGMDALPCSFLTYCMLIEDPVLCTTIYTFSHHIPVDQSILDLSQQAKLAEHNSDRHRGYAISINDLMNSRLKIHDNATDNSESAIWLKIWAGLDEIQLVHELSLTLAHSYKRKWDCCVTNPAT